MDGSVKKGAGKKRQEAGKKLAVAVVEKKLFNDLKI
jgi:hypothetical protein